MFLGTEDVPGWLIRMALSVLRVIEDRIEVKSELREIRDRWTQLMGIKLVILKMLTQHCLTCDQVLLQTYSSHKACTWQPSTKIAVGFFQDL